ncbi:MAG: hypothetical protein AB7N76_20440 [Planctomycetota bacterium]
MLSRALSEALAEHPRRGLFSDPLRGLRRVRALGGELETWVGERPDGSLELVRRGAGEAALELLLNEVRAARAVQEPGLARLLWTARGGDEELLLGFGWRAAHALAYPLDLRWLLRSFIALARAVAALHRAGLVHADLKPEAVLWAEDPQDLLLWDLRISQAPGPRAFDAFSARFAAPEQVAGGELGLAVDVYALGVMLYSLFIRDRFPAIILPKRAGGGAAGPRQAALSAITAFGSLDEEPPPAANLSDTFIPIQEMQQQVGPPPRPRDDQAILGAKILFAIELERVMDRTADIGVAKELLAAIERATAQKPAQRFPDAAAFAEELAKLLALAEEVSAGGGS